MNNKLGVRKWLIYIIVGLAGQFAWVIENMYLNSYIACLNFTSSSGTFNYSLMIAITTAASAIVATLTTLFMGGLTDKLNIRKPFICVGYIIWGLSTASFGLFNTASNSALISISMTAFSASIMVVIVDCVMTFFGSTSNDAAFNSYVTKYTPNSKRAIVEGILSVMPLIAMLIIFVGLNGLTTKDAGYRWDIFFYIIGGLVTLVGVISIFLIPKEEKEQVNREKYLNLIIEGFKPKTIRENKVLYLTLIAYFIYGVGTQIYFPYLMIYVEKTCGIANTGSGILTPFAIVMAVALLVGSLLSVFIGKFADKFGKYKMIIPSIAILMVGLILMFFIPYLSDSIFKIIFACLSALIMILGYVGIPTVLNSIVRETIPTNKEGVFMGVRMIFVVLLPMCIGPFIGDAINSNSGFTYVGDYEVVSSLPSNINYLVALGVLALMIIPVIFIKKIKAKENAK